MRHADFRSLWLAGLVSDAGDWLLFIALPIVVYQLTGSALGTSVAFLVELTPGIVLAPFAGWLADRCDRRRLLLIVSILQSLALLPLLVVHTRADLPVLYAVILVEAALLTVFDPAKNALLPTLLPPAELVSANALIGLNQNLGRLAGGPLGGVLLAVGGLRLTVVADLVSYLLAAVLIGRLSRRATARSEPADPGAHPRAAGGVLVTLRERRTRATLIVEFTSQIAQGIFVVLFILFVAQRLHGGSSEIGLLRGIQAIGAIAAGLALTTLTREITPARLTAWSAFAFGMTEVALWNGPAFTTASWLYITLFALAGAPGILMSTGIISTLQRCTTDRERGRAFGALGLAGNAGQAVGMLAAGLLTVPLGLMTLLNAQAVLYFAAGVAAALWMTGLRAVRPTVPAEQLQA